MSRRLAVALTGVAFAVLVSVAATHLHIGPDGDDGCAVCAAVIGKLEGPTPPALPVPAPASAWVSLQFPIAQIFAAAILVVLPPSCGPPPLA